MSNFARLDQIIDKHSLGELTTPQALAAMRTELRRRNKAGRVLEAKIARFENELHQLHMGRQRWLDAIDTIENS